MYDPYGIMSSSNANAKANANAYAKANANANANLCEQTSKTMSKSQSASSKRELRSTPAMRHSAASELRSITVALNRVVTLTRPGQLRCLLPQELQLWSPRSLPTFVPAVAIIFHELLVGVCEAVFRQPSLIRSTVGAGRSHGLGSTAARCSHGGPRAEQGGKTET